MADSLYEQPSQPIEMKVFQGGGLSAGLEGGGTSLLPTPTAPIEMKVFQGGGQKERQDFENGLLEFRKTNYFNRIQSAPRKPNAAIYFIDTEGRLAVCKRRDPGDKSKDGKIMAAGGAVDSSDGQEFPANPSILACLREGNEEIGINPFRIQDFTKLKQAERQALTAAVNDFIPLWNFGQVEAYIYLLKGVVAANGPDAQHRGELYTNYDFKEFGSNPALISKQKQGVAYVDIPHLIKTVVGNPKLEFTYYSKFFRILGAIQTNTDSASMDNEIHQIIKGGAHAPAAKAAKTPVKQPAKAAAAPVPAAKSVKTPVKEPVNDNEPLIPPPPKGRWISEAGKGARLMRNNENNWGNRKTSKTIESSEVATKKLSNGLTVRVVDNSFKDNIQSLQFTEDENLIFEKELHFDHPFIKEWLQKDENKEKWYEFWKTYINFDGSNKFHLMTYEEGQKIQRFKKEVYEAYRQYLLSAALPFLLKSTNPHALKVLLNPPEEKKGFLFETVQTPPNETKEQEAEPEAEPEAEADNDSIGSSGADTLAPFRRGLREAYIKSDAAGKAELKKQEKMAIHLGEPTSEQIKRWRAEYYKKAAKAPIENNRSSVTSFNYSEEDTHNGESSYSGESETSAGTTSSTNTTESDESTDTNGESIKELDLNSVWNVLFEPVSNKNINALLPEEERIINTIHELNTHIPNMPALREYTHVKKGEAVFTLSESKLTTAGFFGELSKIPSAKSSLLILLRLLIRVDITHFSDQDSFTKFFMKFFNPVGKRKLKGYLEQGAEAAARGGKRRNSLRKRIKTTRKKTKTAPSTATSSRSRVRTSRKGHSK
jgi:hypothetical protein